MPPAKATQCRVCGSENSVDRGRCETHRREFDADKKRKQVIKLRAEMGEEKYLAYQRDRAKGKAKTPPPLRPLREFVPKLPKMDFGVPLITFVPTQPITQRGRVIPPADAPMDVKLEHPEWIEYYRGKDPMSSFMAMPNKRRRDD